MTFFSHIQEAPSDANFGLAAVAKADPRPHKIDLVIGVYRDEKGSCDLMPSVQQVKRELLEEQVATYLPIEGNINFCEQIGVLLFGELWSEMQNRTAGAQMVGGTGALRVGAEFLAQEVSKKVLIPQPSWVNHLAIFERVGYQIETYSSYAKRSFDFASAVDTLRRAPEKSVVLFHAACFNPSGCDPTPEEWEKLSDLVHERSLIPFFDCAYQGFGEGLDQDAAAIRLFVREGHECLIAYSCSKNFSLYSQRVGVLFIVSKHQNDRQRILSQVKRIIRVLYSNPPSYGARLVERILTDSRLKKQWREDLEAMHRRLITLRHNFAKKVDLPQLMDQRGMFVQLDLEKAQLQRLIDEFAIYMPAPGRVNLTGLNAHNFDAVIHAIRSVMR